MATPDFKYWHQIYKDEAAKCNKWEREGALFFVKRERGDGDEPEEQVKQWKKDAAVKQEAVIGKMDCAGEIGDGKPAVWYCPTKSETGIKVSYIWIKSLTQGLIAGKEIKDGEEPRIEFDIPEHCTSMMAYTKSNITGTDVKVYKSDWMVRWDDPVLTPGQMKTYKWSKG